jgi:hypothetical protein
MTNSQLGKHPQLGLLGAQFCAGLAGLGFPYTNSCIIVYTIYLYEIYPFIWLQRGGHGLDVHFGPPYLILDKSPSQLGTSHKDSAR